MGLGFFFWENTHKHTLVACSRTHCTHRKLGRKSISYSVIWPPSEHSFAVLRYGGVSLWCFSPADLIVGVQTAARTPLCSLLFQVHTGGAERRCPSLRDRPRAKISLVNLPEQLTCLLHWNDKEVTKINFIQLVHKLIIVFIKRCLTLRYINCSDLVLPLLLKMFLIATTLIKINTYVSQIYLYYSNVMKYVRFTIVINISFLGWVCFEANKTTLICNP